ncbi:hypothetical protein NQ314_013042 [Rhamnusium bicolor]|uniref:Uncharacterized protein n=1 Tax=Rhamnusium bicolor TaxID=1586634 RepID=A0AAV8X8L6_9CUCU|nr:hypothetical protein NQ314_013042 [Rhamnusium bicolor]
MSLTEIPSLDDDIESDSSKEPSKTPSPVIFEPIVEEEDESSKELEDFCDSKHLLDKNTESFRCLAQIIVSSSSFFRQLVYLFPPLEDPGINDAFEYVAVNILPLNQFIILEPDPIYDDIGVEKYLDICKDLEIVPISRIVRSLAEDTLNLKTLKINAHVENLILQDNWINPNVSELLSSMIDENRTITCLNLRECRIGETGNKKLFNGMKKNDSIRVLNLAWNGIGVRPAISPLIRHVKKSETLQYLDLSNNRLAGGSLKATRTGILKSPSLKVVKMGNNCFPPDEAFLLAAMMKPKKKKAKKDFGHFILSLPEDTNIPKEEFEDLLKKKKMKKLDQDLVNELTSRFPARRQKIDVIEMRRVYMDYYPDTCLPPPKPKKKKKGKKGKVAEEVKVVDATEPEQLVVDENVIIGDTLPDENIIQPAEDIILDPEAAEDETVKVEMTINFENFEEHSQGTQDDTTIETEQGTADESVITDELMNQDQAVGTAD